MLDNIVSILEPHHHLYDDSQFPAETLVYKLIKLIKIYEKKTNKKILEYTWNYYGYAQDKFKSYRYIKINIGGLIVYITFGRITYKLTYNVDALNGVRYIDINNDTYHVSDDGVHYYDGNGEKHYIDLTSKFSELMNIFE